MSDKVYCRDCKHMISDGLTAVCKLASKWGNWYAPDVLVWRVYCHDKNANNDCADFTAQAADADDHD